MSLLDPFSLSQLFISVARKADGVQVKILPGPASQLRAQWSYFEVSLPFSSSENLLYTPINCRMEAIMTNEREVLILNKNYLRFRKWVLVLASL